MDNLQQIHDASMKILETTGFDLFSDEIINIVKNHGVKTVGNRVFFDEDTLMKWVRKAPKSFVMHARNPVHDTVIGGGKSVFMSATSGFPIISEYDGKERSATNDDFITFLKLNQQVPYFHINGGVIVTPSMLPTDNFFPSMLLSMIFYSDKCLLGGMGGEIESKQTMGILKILFGTDDLRDKARVMTIINSSSPLQYHKDTLDTLRIYAQNGQVTIISPGVMAGSTGPVTLAGTIAMANAEALVGVALAQMVCEGAKVIYGSISTAVDMRDSSCCIGTPESAIITKYCAELARFYGLPSRGGGTLTDSRSHTMQTGYESMLTFVNALMEGIDLVIHSAGSLGSYRTMSFEKYIADLQIIEMVQKYLAGIEINNDTLSLDEINKIGPGGEFLTSKHTFAHFRENYIPSAAVRGVTMTTDVGADAEYLRQLRDKKNEMLEEYKQPELDPEIFKDISYFIEKQWKASYHLTNKKSK